jgi:hypothetical protein
MSSWSDCAPLTASNSASGPLVPVYFILEDNDADWRMKIGRATNLRGRRGVILDQASSSADFTHS